MSKIGRILNKFQHLLNNNMSQSQQRRRKDVAKIRKDVAKKSAHLIEKQQRFGRPVWGYIVLIPPDGKHHLCIFARPISAPYPALFGQSLRIFAKIRKDFKIFAIIKSSGYSYFQLKIFQNFMGGRGFQKNRRNESILKIFLYKNLKV